jgi:uncharacterized phiE125 gp8 family phage protein
VGLKLITANTDWAISLEEARTHLLKTSTDTTDDAYIQTLIEAAQKKVEEDCDLGLTAQTWDMYLDDFPSIIAIWMWPVASVDSVKYTDDDGDTQTITSSNYTTDLTQKPARIAPVNSYSWPTPRDSIGAVQVRFTTGFTSPDTIPSDLKQAMLLLIGDWFDNREDKGRRFNRVSEMILNKYKYI